MKVFISHAAADRAIAARLASALVSERFEVLTFWEDVSAGDIIQKSIFDAIAASNAVLVLVSRNSEHSLGLSEELSIARLQPRLAPVKLIPVIVDRNANLPVLLRDIRAVDMTSPDRWDAAISEIVDALRSSRGARRVEDELGYVRAYKAALDEEKLRHHWLERRSVLDSFVGVVSKLSSASGLAVAAVAVWLSTQTTMESFSALAPAVPKFLLAVLGPMVGFVLGYFFGSKRSDLSETE